MTGVISVVISLLVVVIGGMFAVWAPLKQVEKDVASLNKVLDVKEHKSKMDEIERLKTQLEALEKQLATNQK